MAVLFATTAFVSAALLFWVQPMIARIVLPSLGGTPAVWNTCLAFFQATLLAGYAYAHLSVRWLGLRAQAWLHMIVIALPFAVLPLRVDPAGPPAGDNPAGWLLLALAATVGPPFFALAATAPLLQRWFADLGGRDPYPLYAASNLGSILGLLSYPTVVEPSLNLGVTTAGVTQVTLWAGGYALFCGLLVACHLARLTAPPAPCPAQATRLAADPPPTPGRRLRWVALAFVPSSLMMGVTTYVTVDVIAAPLLWVIPLALYLLSFVVTFARRPAPGHAAVVAAMPFLVLPAVFASESGMSTGTILGIVLQLVALFAVALMCHGELARSRPAPARLTEFYMLVSAGGVLGGLFNALVAPLIFPTVIEHEVALVLACLLLPARRAAGPLFTERLFRWRPSRVRGWAFDALAALLVGLFTIDILLAAARHEADTDSPANGLVPALAFGGPLLACLAFRGRPLRLGLAVAAVIAACRLNGPLPQPGRATSTVVHRARSFFSVLTVEVEAAGTPAESHVLTHGTTLHGQQFTDPRLRREPLTYYTRSGPVGQVMRAVAAAKPRKAVALVGLGAGATACYGDRGDALDCYEIDPAVARIARDREYFTYLADCEARGCLVRIVLGDARLRLREAADHAYDVIVVDAFSSDAVPVHLLTREAVGLYLAKLAPAGYLLVHISNRFLDLEPVVGNVAAALNVTAYFQCDDLIDLPGKWESNWVVVLPDAACGPRLLAQASSPPRWQPAATDARVGVWTDDYSNLFSVFRPR